MGAELWIDGAPATADDLARQALVNYGAYTSFAVRSGGVRGLDLHLDRLERSAIELFGEAPARSLLRDRMRQALGDQADAWLRISLFSREISPRISHWIGAPSVMVGVFPPVPPLASSLRLQSQVYQREAAHLKHAATLGAIRARRMAGQAGFDDALFAGGDGVISEGSLWNIGFIEDETIVWPKALMLAGTGQALIERGLEAVGLKSATRPVKLTDVSGFDGAFICNSATPAAAVALIDQARLDTDPAMINRLEIAWASNPIQPI